MGMSASTYTTKRNEITYDRFCDLGGLCNPRLFTRTHGRPGNYHTTYHVDGDAPVYRVERMLGPSIKK